MHIYYATRGLRGRPYHSDMINTDLFAFFREKECAPSPPQKRCALSTPFPNAILIWGKTRIPNMCVRKGRSTSPKASAWGSRQRRLGR